MLKYGHTHTRKIWVVSEESTQVVAWKPQVAYNLVGEGIYHVPLSDLIKLIPTFSPPLHMQCHVVVSYFKTMINEMEFSANGKGQHGSVIILV